MITTMNHSHDNNKIEKLGFYLSVVCAIHCIATPVLITILPFLGSSLVNHSWEIWFIGGSLILAGTLLYTDFRKHQKSLPLMLLGASLCTKLMEILWTGDSLEFITGSVGALFIAAAYYFNWKYKKACGC